MFTRYRRKKGGNDWIYLTVTELPSNVFKKIAIITRIIGVNPTTQFRKNFTLMGETSIYQMTIKLPTGMILKSSQLLNLSKVVDTLRITSSHIIFTIKS